MKKMLKLLLKKNKVVFHVFLIGQIFIKLVKYTIAYNSWLSFSVSKFYGILPTW